MSAGPQRRGPSPATLVGRVAIVFGVALAWTACAAKRPEPDAPGPSCDASADCASPESGAQCGFVRLCIAGHCEALDDAGMPVSATATCAPR